MKSATWSLIFAATVAVLLPSFVAHAETWDGGGDGVNWADPLNWDTNAPIVSGSAGQTLNFFSGTLLPTTQNFGGTFSLQNLVFGGGGPYTIGGNPISFDNLGSNPQLATSGGGPTVTFNVPVSFNASTLTNVSGATFASGATVASGTTLQIQGTFTGGTIVNNGNILVDFANVSADISGPGTLNFNFSGSLTGNNTYSGGSTLTNSQVFGTTSGIQGNWTMTNGQIGFQQNVAGSTSANISGSGIVSVFGTGQVTLLSASSYSGNTNVSAHLGIGNNGALGTSTLTTFGGKVSAEGGSRTLANPLDFAAGVEFTGTNNLTFTHTGAKNLNSGPNPELRHTSTATTDIAGTFNGTVNSLIDVQSGTLKLGAAVNNGFRMDGAITVASGATLQLVSNSLVRLGQTNLNGGTIVATNGVTLPSGLALTAAGAIQGRVAAEAGSVIEATGPLTMGDVNSFAGFFSNGELREMAQSIVINDRNQAVLGSLTEVGTGSNAGLLQIPNGAFIEFGRAITGWGTVDSNNNVADAMIINGSVAGTSFSQPLDFTGYVKGLGDFSNMIFSGTFSPGLSPAIVPVNNVILSSNNLLLMEIGGLNPGSQHDQLDITGMLGLNGTLDVDLIMGFNPSLGDAFQILDGTTLGTFSGFSLPPLSPGLSWDTSDLYTTGHLKIVVPEPSAGFLLLLGAISLRFTCGRRTQLRGLHSA